MAPVLNKKPYQKGAYFPLNTQYLLGFNEPNKACVLRPYFDLLGSCKVSIHIPFSGIQIGFLRVGTPPARASHAGAALTAPVPVRRSQANLTSMQAAQLWPQVVAVRAPAGVAAPPTREALSRQPRSHASGCTSLVLAGYTESPQRPHTGGRTPGATGLAGQRIPRAGRACAARVPGALGRRRHCLTLDVRRRPPRTLG